MSDKELPVGYKEMIPDKVIVELYRKLKAKRREASGKAPRPLSAYNEFVKLKRKEGLSMKEVGALWKQSKEKT